jgi:molybdate transport system ATP-binding protein
MSNLILIQLADAQVHFRGATLGEELQFTWKQGEHWAVFGDSGKSLTGLLETLLGKTLLQQGSLETPFARDYTEQQSQAGQVHSFRDLIALVSQDYPIRNKAGLQNFYYQQRFNSADVHDTITVGSYLESIPATRKGPWTTEKVAQLLRLNHLLDASLLMLSNGETRRLSLAAGLLRQPLLYLMDQPLTGLDQESRAAFGDFLAACIQVNIHVLLTTTSSEIPPQITHIAYLKDSGVLQTWERTKFDPQTTPVQVSSWDLAPILPTLASYPFYAGPVVSLKEVSIRYGQTLILDRLNWNIQSGERWRLRGKNGSGKSTLISLLIGENPQAYSQNFSLFGKKRGSGESIWELKKPIGFVAPELSRYFPRNQSLRKVILSGLFDTLGLFKSVTPEQEALARSWMEAFQLKGLAERYFFELSLAQQRWALLARALIKKPQLLILDEASQGLDEQQRDLFRNTLQDLLTRIPTAVIYVSHYEQDVPPCVDLELALS